MSITVLKEDEEDRSVQNLGTSSNVESSNDGVEHSELLDFIHPVSDVSSF
jgi:hypothetical protein